MVESKGKKSYEPDEIIDGEVVSEFGGETYFNLPHVPDDQDVEQPTGFDTSRRDFVLRLAVGGAAALALGGSAALLVSRQNQGGKQTEVILPYGSNPGSDNVPSNVAELVQRVADLEHDLAARSAERDQAVSDLNIANTKNQELQAQLDAAIAQLNDAKSLNGLWQALDDVGLDSITQGALTVLGGALTTVVQIMATVQSGLTVGQNALQTFLKAIPNPAAGIKWLQSQVTALSNDLDWLSDQVEQAVQPVQPLAEQIAQFVLWVLERLPFGAGDRARAGLEAMQTVIGNLPDLISGINTSVLNPLASWFGDDKKKNLTGTLVDPLQTRVMTPTKDFAAKVSAFKTSYDQDFATPAQAALEQRAQIREQIKDAQARLSWLA